MGSRLSGESPGKVIVCFVGGVDHPLRGGNHQQPLSSERLDHLRGPVNTPEPKPRIAQYAAGKQGTPDPRRLHRQRLTLVQLPWVLSWHGLVSMVSAGERQASRRGRPACLAMLDELRVNLTYQPVGDLLNF